MGVYRIEKNEQKIRNTEILVCLIIKNRNDKRKSIKNGE